MLIKPIQALLVFLLGAAAGLIGDAGHVLSGTTRYLDTGGVPFLWESPFWFPLAIGLATVALTELSLRNPGPTRPADWSDAAAIVATVLGAYALTTLEPEGPWLPTTVFIWAIGILAWKHFGQASARAAVIGAITAIVGSSAEIGLYANGVFTYSESINVLAGVPPWLPGLYFAFGSASVLLGAATGKVSTS
ncbi:hypothetical protein D5S17_17225 [Pseudonocardiaceae bacterium YIM PH 21723]|nr:hypothetical protein D5S17_17225 [Pseudonocardiaceae bacterium YIM PH 21723]